MYKFERKQKTKWQWDYIRLSTIIISMMLVLLICLLPKGFAAELSEAELSEAEIQDKYGKLNKIWAESILDGGTKEISETIDGTGTYSNLYSFLTGVNFSSEDDENGIHRQFNTVLKPLLSTLKYLAGVWVVVIAAGNLVKGIGDGRDAKELVLKFFFEICVTMIIIINLDEIIPLFCTIVHSLSQKIDSIEFTILQGKVGAQATLPSWQNFIHQVSGKPEKIWPLGYGLYKTSVTLDLLIPGFMSKVIWVASLFVLLQTLLEIGIRRAFLPFAIADIYNEGLRSPGARYIKKFVGAMMKFGICILASKLTSIIGFTGDGIALAFNLIVINLVAVGVMFKAGEYTNDILGA